ncbi:hypothetical protein P8V03_16070 [Clostridium sp. A1-XYC3]|uniref:Uncharacterized protein n=1 Tax=Clostridium tanneri TaxID=3037988 RepID=A0ABU4JWX6_9CLOT|nr:hypothetical protein [Clostridium sp. A1-XYC3]MDW8802665.1 hypothetical protein [Clostridium sp. A1-XYC3]
MNEEMEYFNYLNSLKRKEIKNKFSFLGEGISRRVYDLNNGLVLKLAKGREGHYQNQVEHFVYTHADLNQKKYLCPILFFTPRMIVMKKAEPLTSKIKAKYLNLKTIRPEESSFEDINNLAKRFLLLYEDIVSPTSWGSLNEKNVLIDYGCTCEEGDKYYHLIFRINRLTNLGL